jgi:ABC-type transporter Mla MlaB component
MNTHDKFQRPDADAAGAVDDDDGGGPAPLAPSGDLSIYTVAEMRPRWLAWMADWADAPSHPAATLALGTPARPTLSAAAIDAVDAAGVQLLLALDHALGQRGHRLHIQAPSHRLQAGCSAMGLEDWLQARSDKAFAVP